MNQVYVTKEEQREVASILKDLPREDRVRIEGIIVGYHVARRTTARVTIVSTAPQPTTT